MSTRLSMAALLAAAGHRRLDPGPVEVGAPGGVAGGGAAAAGREDGRVAVGEGT
jgi:hypothetical protein